MDDSSDGGNKKRPRDENSADPDINSPETKTRRVGSVNVYGDSCKPEQNWFHSDLDANSSECQLTRQDSAGSSVTSNVSDRVQAESLNSPEAKRIQDDLLNILEETDSVPNRDLDLVMRSFQEEIMMPGSGPVKDSGEMQSDLGYLLEASDDELGLPPTGSSGEEKSVEQGFESVKQLPEVMGFNGFFGFEDAIPSYDSLEMGLGTDSGNSYLAEFVTDDGLFEYSEPGDGLWRYE